MGDPKKTRKKYHKPSHPWQKERIEEEKIILREYGLKNKKEIWKSDSLLRNFKNQVKKLIAATSQQAEKEKNQLLRKLQNLDLIKRTAMIDDVLGLTLKDIMNRRLQTIVYKKGLAGTINQARQFIVHKHITLDDKKISAPSYLVLKNEEDKLGLVEGIKDAVKTNDEKKAEEKPKPQKTEKKQKKETVKKEK